MKIPREAYSAPVDAAARLVLLLLWEYARANEACPIPFAWPSAERLAAELACTDRSVFRSLATLRSAALIWPGTSAGRYDDNGRGKVLRGWYLRAPEDTDDLVIDPYPPGVTRPSLPTDDLVSDER